MVYNKSARRVFFLVLALIKLCSCLTVGRHGSIKAYAHPVSKNVFQKVVEKVIAENDDVKRDTTKNYIIDISNGKNDTIINNTVFWRREKISNLLFCVSV